VLEPHFDPDAVTQLKEDLALQIADYRNTPAQFVPEMLHAIAFGSHADAEGGVGRPLLCSARDLEQLTASAAEQFLQRRLIGPRVVVIGHGVDHSVLEGHAKTLVGGLPKTAAGGASTRASAYRGGSHSLEATADDQNVTHIAVAFEGARAGSPESYVSCLLQLLFGGGDSFSTGGPGKGMHSMLYRDVLVRYGQVRTCVAFNHCYGDTGLFGVFASASDTTAQVLTEVVLTELAIVARGVSDEAFARAKNQLKGQVLMNIESRLVLFEDMARQMVVSGQYVDPATVCEHIDAVTVAGLVGICHSCHAGAPFVSRIWTQGSDRVGTRRCRAAPRSGKLAQSMTACVRHIRNENAMCKTDLFFFHTLCCAVSGVNERKTQACTQDDNQQQTPPSTTTTAVRFVVNIQRKYTCPKCTLLK
jgi:processing peptidase subunit alpha